jgi:hypothetical protein
LVPVSPEISQVTFLIRRAVELTGNPTLQERRGFEWPHSPRIAIMSETFPCPCCGNLTLSQQPPGTYWTCEVCGWEDHPGTFEDHEFVCGTNGVVLRQARENYKVFGASDAWLIPKIRKPKPEGLP